MMSLDIMSEFMLAFHDVAGGLKCWQPSTPVGLEFTFGPLAVPFSIRMKDLCGDVQTIAKHIKSIDCTNVLGAKILCPADNSCCGGICAVPGAQCCTNSLGDNFVCGPESTCCGNLCAGKGSKCC